MTNYYHEPIEYGENNLPNTLNSRLGPMDAAIKAAYDRASDIIADSGTSSTEVVDARDGETVLYNRLGLMELGVYNVLREPYSADNTGSTDTEAAIQAAIDDAEAAGGGIVFLPKGIYRLAGNAVDFAALNIAGSNIIFCGQGASTILKAKDSAGSNLRTLLLVGAAGEIQNVVIRDIAFDGNKANQSGSYDNKNLVLTVDLDVDEPMNAVVHNVWSYNAYSGHLPIEGGGISIDGFGTLRELPASTSTLDYYRKNIIVTNCHCYDNQGWGIGTNWGSGIIIANNVCYGNSTMGVTIWNTQDTIVEGNYCYQNESNGLNCEISDRITFNGNIVRQVNTGGAALSMYNSLDILVTNNNLHFTGSSSSHHTLYIRSLEGVSSTTGAPGTTFKRRACDRVRVHSNILKRVGAGAGGQVIACETATANINDNIVITGNHLEDLDTIDKCALINAANVVFNHNTCIGRLVFQMNTGSLIANGNYIYANFNTARHIFDLSSVGDVLISGNHIRCTANVASIFSITGVAPSIIIENNLSTGTPQRYCSASSAGDFVTPMFNGNRHRGSYSVGPTNNLVFPPSAGTWSRGDILWILNSGAATYAGYVCTVAGTPGTWKGIAMTES